MIELRWIFFSFSLDEGGTIDECGGEGTLCPHEAEFLSSVAEEEAEDRNLAIAKINSSLLSAD